MWSEGIHRQGTVARRLLSGGQGSPSLSSDRDVKHFTTCGGARENCEPPRRAFIGRAAFLNAHRDRTRGTPPQLWRLSPPPPSSCTPGHAESDFLNCCTASIVSRHTTPSGGGGSSRCGAKTWKDALRRTPMGRAVDASPHTPLHRLEGCLLLRARSARQSRVPEGGQLRLRQRAHRLGVALVAVKIVLLQRRHLVPMAAWAGREVAPGRAAALLQRRLAPVAGRLLPQLLVHLELPLHQRLAVVCKVDLGEVAQQRGHLITHS